MRRKRRDVTGIPPPQKSPSVWEVTGGDGGGRGGSEGSVRRVEGCEEGTGAGTGAEAAAGVGAVPPGAVAGRGRTRL